jgi:RNA polymerase sigma-70 factor (ECF subfamily)
MSAFSDTDLPFDVLERARSGDVAAWEAIYRAFERPVFTLVRRLVPQRAAAEDLAQDVFVEVLTRLQQYEARGSFAGWVRAIAVSKCLMHLRSPWRRGLRWIDVESADASDASSWAAEPARGDRDARIDLARSLERLPDNARVVVWLHDVEGFTHAEIGALFGKTASFSKSQLLRAHEKLRAMLQPSGVKPSCMPIPTSY